MGSSNPHFRPSKGLKLPSAPQIHPLDSVKTPKRNCNGGGQCVIPLPCQLQHCPTGASGTIAVRQDSPATRMRLLSPIQSLKQIAALLPTGGQDLPRIGDSGCGYPPSGSLPHL